MIQFLLSLWMETAARWWGISYSVTVVEDASEKPCALILEFPPRKSGVRDVA